MCAAAAAQPHRHGYKLATGTSSLPARAHSCTSHLDIDIAGGLVLAAEQAVPRTRLIEDRQRGAARLCTGFVHHIPAHELNLLQDACPAGCHVMPCHASSGHKDSLLLGSPVGQHNLCHALLVAMRSVLLSLLQLDFGIEVDDHSDLMVRMIAGRGIAVLWAQASCELTSCLRSCACCRRCRGSPLGG